ncbi:uncharacterized protein KNAG_0A07930 [Huiozyma naganishii CBS 8797]|uniref:BAR domain-containing protein n=1 Tax=Huiozyma naganishii (strain ATCC MYA-139 / BCRC 22969 / CBS 8797 / KCTC 17520 / NBRC 10181 / NCYC 3082 / Yp74L-3) TaxID=1071383 RepID=J7S490_HUIN7|nr:hypothetical protein KNAG_0A07930 [Kazachstania naganishii CBS 8797]CCK68446.1 hypothetical protein KNAG_0A07930 [Kazachstania naganishii CBS 8797]
MFSNFSLDKLTSTITNAAQSAQDTIHNTILSPDAQTKLQFLKTTRYFQEKVGTISEDEIAKLPEGYQRLQEKSEAMEKVLKRLLVVTKTFELEGYDYPPNVTESLNHWWNEDENKKKKTQDFGDSSILNRSFAIAIGKAVLDSQYILSDLKEQQKTRGTEEKKVKREEEAEAAEEEDEADDGEQEAEDEEEEEEDIDMNNMISAFGLWSNCYKNIDQSKAEMDSMIVKEFNQKLTDMLEIDFKTVHKLCTRVQDSRLEFDTLRHKLKLKELEKEARRQVMEEVAEQQAEASGEPVRKRKSRAHGAQGGRKSTTEEAEKTSASENDSSKKSGKASGKSKKGKETAEEPQTEPKEAPPAAEAKEEPPAKETAPAKESNEAEEEENKLLERLEDEFVSNITAAVEKMTELTDSSELISLVKLFQNIQLVHYRQCVQELEASMKSLDELEAESLFE